MLKHLVNSWLVVVLCAAFGGTLAAVHLQLNEKILKNQREQASALVPQLVPGAQSGVEVQRGALQVYEAKAADGTTLGWVIPASGRGFADVIQVLIGVDPKAERITGMSVLAQKETPGLGDKITRPAWLGQFAGKDTATPLAVVKGKASGQQISAVTAATISSQAVSTIVNQALSAFRAELAKPQN